MFKNYLKIAVRNVGKRKLNTALNCLGLATGLTFALLVGSFIWSELRVNNTLKNADNQYIIRSRWTQPGIGYEDVTVAPLGKKLREEYPDLVANYYRFDVLTTAVSVGDKHFVREAAYAGDPTLMIMYGFPMLYGDARTALRAPNSVVITQENALRYFGKTDVLGQVMQLSNYTGGQQDFTVTGVLKSLPVNSITALWDLPVGLFIPFDNLQGRTEADRWTTLIVANYIELQNGVTPQDLQKPIRKLIATYAPKQVSENLQPYLTPLPDFYRDFNKGIVRKTILTLSGIALFILLMALVNFVNSAIASSSSRIREIGVRKGMGSLRSHLMAQFLVESTVVAGLSMALSLLLYEVFRTAFAEVVGKPIDSLWSLSPYFLLAASVLTGLIGLLAGLYPAVTLSGLSAVDALRGQLKSVNEGILLRRFLITAQFSIAGFVCCGAIIIARQVTYLFTTDLGYSGDSVMLVSLPRDWTPQGVARIKTIRDELSRLSVVNGITTSSATLKGSPAYDIKLYPAGTDSTGAISTAILQTDEHFVDTYQIPMMAGQFFQSSEPARQADKLVLNEAACRGLGYKNPQTAIGKSVYSQGYDKPITIIGVTKDFSFRSMREKVVPTAISHVNGAGNLFAYFSIKLGGKDLPGAVAQIEQTFHQLLPNEAFEASFVDEAQQQLYQSERQLKRASQTATVLALVIVLLGIFGLVSLSVARRTKEVGIRKVLGASVPSIIGLFLSEYGWILLIANAVAWPAAYGLMTSWLAGYAYHTPLTWSPFVWTGLGLAVGTGVMVSLRVMKTALMNPVKSLRSE